MNSYSDQKSLLRKNTISSFVFQATTIICGLIVPRLILKNYGSINNLDPLYTLNYANEHINVCENNEFRL